MNCAISMNICNYIILQKNVFIFCSLVQSWAKLPRIAKHFTAWRTWFHPPVHTRYTEKETCSVVTIAPELLNGRKVCELTKLLTPFLTHALVYSRKWPLLHWNTGTFNNPPVSSCQPLSLSYFQTLPLPLTYYNALLLKANATEVLVDQYMSLSVFPTLPKAPLLMYHPSNPYCAHTCPNVSIPMKIALTHATRALQSHDLSGVGINFGSHTFFWPHKGIEGLPGWGISSTPGPYPRQHEHESRYTPFTHPFILTRWI